jgi:hypothetical protein
VAMTVVDFSQNSDISEAVEGPDWKTWGLRIGHDWLGYSETAVIKISAKTFLYCSSFSILFTNKNIPKFLFSVTRRDII